MTHRFDLRPTGNSLTIFFQGLMDRQALAELELLSQTHKQREKSIRVLLGAGTTVDAETLERLVNLQRVTVAAESPFLSRWIERCKQDEPSSRKEEP